MEPRDPLYTPGRCGSDSFETRLKRLNNAVLEIEKSINYEYFIINDQLERAQQEMADITVRGLRGALTREGALRHRQVLLDEFQSAPWLRPLTR